MLFVIIHIFSQRPAKSPLRYSRCDIVRIVKFFMVGTLSIHRYGQPSISFDGFFNVKPTHSVKPSIVLYQVPGIRIILGVFKRCASAQKTWYEFVYCCETSTERETGCPLPSTAALCRVIHTRRELATRHSSSGRAKNQLRMSSIITKIAKPTKTGVYTFRAGTWYHGCCR